MDQVASDHAVEARPLAVQAAGAHNGLAEHVAAVQAARTQLGRDLDRLSVEARAQMGLTMEKFAWKVAAAGSGIIALLVTRKAMNAGWRAARHHDPPLNPAAPGTSWGEALAWTMATAAGVGVAKVVAVRGAAAGWRRLTGTPPPGLTEA